MQRYVSWFRDNEGRGYPGASVSVYVAGTQTLAQIYAAPGSVNAPVGSPNPFTTGADGYFAFAAPNGTYDIQVAVGGQPTTVIPNITFSDLTPVAGPFAATNVTVSTTTTLSSQNVQAALQELDGDITSTNTALTNLTLAVGTNDSLALHKAGAENVTGIKNFTIQPVSINATAIDFTPQGNISSTQVAFALRELDNEKAIDTQVVHKTGNESIAGQKTFTDLLLGVTTARFGATTSYTEFEGDGTLRMQGEATVWNDWNLNRDFTPNAGVGVPNRNTFIGNIVKDQFAVNDALQLQSTEYLHDYKEGTDVQAHIHWATGTTNNATPRGVKWEIEYTVCNPIESGFTPTAWTIATTTSAEFSIPANQPDRTHRVSTIANLPGSSFKIGAQILMRLKRIASVATAPAADPFLVSFGLHYESDTIGSRNTFGK